MSILLLLNMPIDDIRAKQKADQTQAIKTRLEAGSIVRIGNLLPITGRYEVLDSDGGISNNGVKVYNTQEEYGDRVLAYPRSDDTIALDSEKGSIVRPPTAFPVCPGYLAGQVFNCEEPKKKKGQVWILYTLNGNVYVGGHQESPELTTEPSINIESDTAQIWGDQEGWEVAFKKYTEVGYTSIAGAKVKKHLSGLVGESQLVGNVRYLGKGVYGTGAEYMSGLAPGGSFRYAPGPYPGSALLDVEGMAIGQPGVKVFTESGGQSIGFDIVVGQGMYSRYYSDSALITPFPAPYASKSQNVTEALEFGIYPPVPAPGVQRLTRTNSYEGLFRDRSVFLLSKTNSENLKTSYYPDGSSNTFPQETLEYLISDGVTDTTLFSLSFDEIKEYTKSLYNPTFGETYDYGINHVFNLFDGRLRAQGNGPSEYVRNLALKQFKFNYPVFTKFDTDDRPKLLTHLNDVRPYDIKVYDARIKASLIDGENTIATVDAWGIPAGALILDVAAWVP